MSPARISWCRTDVEIAFNVIHGTFGEDGQVQRILEARGVPYTGEGVAGSELAIDKIATQAAFHRARRADAGVRDSARNGATPTLPLPLRHQGAARRFERRRLYRARRRRRSPRRSREARSSGRELLVEQFIEGRELTVGIVGDQALPIIEIVAKNDFYNFENKYPFLNPNAAGADHFCPARARCGDHDRVQETALAAHRALDLEVYSRVDLLLAAKTASRSCSRSTRFPA